MTSIPQPTQERRALLVVVDGAMRQLCRETLAHAGFTVVNGFDSGAAAVVSAREKRPDIIILSQQLSDVPASEAARWLRSNSDLTSTPIIILGGRVEASPAGVTILPRPITSLHLLGALSGALGSDPIGRRAS